MKKFVLAAAIVVSCCSLGFANITGLNYSSDGDGSFVCSNYTWTGSVPDLTLGVYGDQYGATGHMLGTIDTDSPDDPSLTIRSTVDNDTGFDWTSYHVNVYMSVTNVLSGVIVYSPGDWTISITQQPVWNGTEFEGQLDLVGGAAITNGASPALDFAYKLTFAGSSHYSFTQEMIAVPEPSPVELLTLSGLLLGAFAFVRQSRRS